MCCIFLTISHPVYQLILISNRDEFLTRATRPSHWHRFPDPHQDSNSLPQSTNDSHDSPSNDPSSSDILSGIDADPSGGGTWLGITKNGRFGALTNFTEIKPPPLPKDRGLVTYRSRGGLVKQWLSNHNGEGKEESKPENYLSSVARHSDEYPGFNLLVGQLAKNHKENIKLGYLSNREDQPKGNEEIYDSTTTSINEKFRKDPTLPSAKRIDLQHGGRVYTYPSILKDETSTLEKAEMKIDSACESCGLSNSTLDERWEKVNNGKVAFEKVLNQANDVKGKGKEEDELIEELFKILGTSAVDTITSRQDMKSSVLIPPFKLVDRWYATRTATILLVERPGIDSDAEKSNVKARWIERDVFILDKDGEPIRSRDEGREDQRRWEWEFGERTDLSN